MLLTIALIILVLWLLGFGFHIAGAFIHLLLVIGIVLLIVHFLTGGREGV